VKPRAPVRRFDVFAEYNKLEAQRDGRPLDEAKGHGLWIAKVVAARRFGAGRGSGPPPSGQRSEPEADAPPEHEKFKSLSGEPQTDAMFDREVVARMGDEFYREVFAPTIKAHFERGDSYQAIRDFVRKGWRPER
jgi:hypothetical protein